MRRPIHLAHQRGESWDSVLPGTGITGSRILRFAVGQRILHAAGMPVPLLPDTRQAEALRYVAAYRKRHSMGPSHLEIAQWLGLKTQGGATNVTPYIRPLLARNLLSKSKASRSLDVTEAGRAWFVSNPVPAIPELPEQGELPLGPRPGAAAASEGVPLA